MAGIIFAKKQHILVRAVGQGDAWHEIALDYEVRDEKEFFKAIATHRKPKEMVSLAAHILDTKPTNPTLRKLVKRKAAGKPTLSSS